MNPQLTNLPNDYAPRGTMEMLIYENLARSRMREAEREARERRLVRRLSSARRWRTVAKWAARHADRATSTL